MWTGDVNLLNFTRLAWGEREIWIRLAKALRGEPKDTLSRLNLIRYIWSDNAADLFSFTAYICVDFKNMFCSR